MTIHPTDALLLIDLQPDFMPGGALAIAGGDQILPLINTLARRFDHVLLTQDWHPPEHISFASTHARNPFEVVRVPYGPQTLWPDHCLQHTPGAALHPALDIPTPSSSSARASASISTATPPSSKTTTPRPPGSQATCVNVGSSVCLSPAWLTITACASPPSTAGPSASRPSSSKTPPAL